MGRSGIHVIKIMEVITLGYSTRFCAIIDETITLPFDTNVVLMLGQRCRRWHSIKPTSWSAGSCCVFCCGCVFGQNATIGWSYRMLYLWSMNSQWSPLLAFMVWMSGRLTCVQQNTNWTTLPSKQGMLNQFWFHIPNIVQKHVLN